MGGLSLEVRGEVRIVRLGEGECRFDRTLLEDLNAVLDTVEDAGAVALVSIGSDRFYSNGYDLGWLATLEKDERRGFIRDHQALLARWLVLPVPTVAAVSGHAFGAGALLALAHDVCVARDDHGSFCLPEIDAGIPLRRGMMALVRARLPPRAARDAVLTGRRFVADEAVEAGFADRAVPDARLLDIACEIARTRAPQAGSTLGAMKRGLYDEAHRLLDESSRGVAKPKR